ncbi:formate dehydrogenase subunit alpha [Alphaproteobacteria bacterium]|jgi:formate dehydrogenase major subunit|nr:formate dehydrogenase subunit alpha [Alphaproteobacteria bacterium]MDA9035270.1 formate dehydrogenase subunit alpha [bacterium]MDC1407060.1 formate dehydrogenase subunit alpha [Candidatus Puniceispirillum sp.]MDA8648951.1 formate dehydrogenase subunit alpha [Alphaproteobacteria bacterium]MDA8723393.1 formate dehydrogenase subunit alpha [Alphaproteobacteria bacterium]
MLRKKTSGVANGPLSSSFIGKAAETVVDRRAFLRGSGLAIGGLATAAALVGSNVTPAQAVGSAASVEIRKSVCTHCSVGCTVVAEVQNGVWTGQEPGWDSPINLGAHCAKGASVRETASGERRLKYPMKLTGGKWVRMSWDDAINEIGDQMLDIREKSGPDSVYWLGSAKHSNEQAYLFRKFYAYWGTNNGDHQARICHSTTVAGVANTWGYGAMTNSYNDMHNSKAIFIIGGNPAEAHPVSLMHVLKAKEQNNAPVIVCDPRFTRTAAHADEYVRFRPGSDVALIWGIMWHIFDNKWEDKEFIRQRVYGMEDVMAEVKKWDPAETERVTGVPGAQLKRVAKIMANNRPGTFVWCMGGTQHTNGNNNTRAYCAFQLALGNMGTAGGGANIFRGHCNVQGATDFCVLSHSLPGYYGLSAGAWKHWARVWDEDIDWLKGRFDSIKGKDGKSKSLMNQKGIPVSRWIDGVLEDKENIDQPDNLRAMVFWGHAPNSQTRMKEMKTAMEKLDLMVVIDPYPTVSAVLSDRTDGVYLLPATTQFETYGSVTASNRSLQWREKIIEPSFDSLPDHTIIYKFAKKFGFADRMFRKIKVTNDEPYVEDVTREFNGGMWTIGYTGQSPERIKAHMANQHVFDRTTLQAVGGELDGEYYGLPWPCWGTAEMGHPGTPLLYDTSKPVAEGGLCFRARFGVEHEGNNLLAEGSYPVGSEIKDGYPEFTMGMLKKLGWDGDLTADERAAIEKVAGDKTNWKVDLSGGIQRVAIKHGCAPFGNAKARVKVWTFPDPIPLHREPLYTSRRDLVADYPTYSDRKLYRLPTLYKSIQDVDHTAAYPMILTSGRLVEYEGGGDETRSNPWLAELQQDMFVEMNPFDANGKNIRNGDMVWVKTPEGAQIKVMAQVTERVAKGVAFLPFHFGGHLEGKDLRSKYPEGADPYVLGESANTAFTYGYDSVTLMQESKCSLCTIERV